MKFYKRILNHNNILNVTSLRNMLSILNNSRRFSTTSPSYIPTLDERNANHWSKKRSDAREEAQRQSASIEEKIREKIIGTDEYYKTYNDWLIPPKPESDAAEYEIIFKELAPEKVSNIAEDEAASIRAKCILEIHDKRTKGFSDDSPDIKQARREYRHEIKALNDALKDNNYDIAMDRSLDAEPENTKSAIFARGGEIREKVFKDICDSDIDKYENSVEEYFKKHPDTDTKDARDDPQEYVKDKRDLIKERDQYLALQQQSEPMDLCDPDG